MYQICLFLFFHSLFIGCVYVCAVCCAFLFYLFHSTLCLFFPLSVVFRFYTSIDNIHFGKQRERFNIDLINTTHFELISLAYFFFVEFSYSFSGFFPALSIRYLSFTCVLLLFWRIVVLA